MSQVESARIHLQRAVDELGRDDSAFAKVLRASIKKILASVEAHQIKGAK